MSKKKSVELAAVRDALKSHDGPRTTVGELARKRLAASPEGKVAVTLTTSVGECSSIRVDGFPWCAVCQDYVLEVQEWREARSWRPGEIAPPRQRSYRVRCHGEWDTVVVDTSETTDLKIGGVAFEAEAQRRKLLGP